MKRLLGFMVACMVFMSIDLQAGRGGAIAGGVLGGMALGGLIGAAASEGNVNVGYYGPYDPYGYGPYYAYGPYPYGPRYYYGPGPYPYGW